MLTMRVVLYLASSLFLSRCALGEVFSSTARLQTLYESSDRVEELLEDYIEHEEERLSNIRGIMKEIQLMTKNKTTSDGVPFVEHPLGAFHLIKRYSQITDWLQKCTYNGEVLQWQMESEGLGLPNTDDYVGSASALSRLQRIYKLSKDELLGGSVAGRFIEPLSIRDTNAIANNAMEMNFFGQATEWYDVALREEDPDPAVTHEERRQSALGLINIYLQHNDLEHAEIFANWSKTTYPSDEAVNEIYNEVLKRKSQLATNSSELPPPVVPANIDENYAALCRGEVDWNNAYLSRGYCRVNPGFVPYRPIKQEILSMDPFVSLFYDVLTEREGESFREHAKENMYRAQVGDNANSVVSDVRVGQLTWLNDSLPWVQKISNRVMELTGLDVTYREIKSSSEAFQQFCTTRSQAYCICLTDSVTLDTKVGKNTKLVCTRSNKSMDQFNGAFIEDLRKIFAEMVPEVRRMFPQVVNYGIGGHYAPHLDVFDDIKVAQKADNFPENLVDTGERLATFLFYPVSVNWLDFQRDIWIDYGTMEKGIREV